MSRKKFPTNTILLLALIIIVSSFFVYFASVSYTGYITHLGGQPNKLIVHYFADSTAISQYAFVSIVNLDSAPQLVTVKFWRRNGELVASGNNTIQPNAQWLLTSGSGAGPAGSRNIDGYLTIEAADVSSLRAQAFLSTSGSSPSVVPLTISSTLYSPYGPSTSSPTPTQTSTQTPPPTTTSQPSDSTLPDTIIISRPRNGSISTSPFFSFNSNIASSTFECSLDGGPFESCTSPKRYTELSRRTTHTFSVRAKDALGNIDSTPATFTWRIL